MSAASSMLLRLHAAGADALLRDGRLILSGVRRLSPELVEEARARRADLLVEIAARANNNATSETADDAIERAAIQVEELPVQRVRQRMASWPQADDEPQIGDYCGCCSAQIWWTAAPERNGWRCSWCHPVEELPLGTFQARVT